MGRIQSSVGLASGIPTKEIIDQLMQVAARPRDLLNSRVKTLQAEQTATAGLTALVVGLQLSVRGLKTATAYRETKVSSSDAASLSAQSTGTPAAGTYKYTPIQQAQSHQVFSTGFETVDAELTTGSVSFRFGGFVDPGVQLDELNGGKGVERGKLRITDRSGVSAVIDLRHAKSIDDVLAAINGNETINVTASVSGDSLKLVDNTGQAASNLRVQEVSRGKTAAGLGLASIDVAANQATGQDVLSLHDDLKLSQLNDGNGVSIRPGVADLTITFRDNSPALEIEFDREKTLGELVATINTADPTRLRAALSADGDRIELTDRTSGAGSFTAASTTGGSLAEDLGLTSPAVAGVITGRHLQSGLKSSLLNSLNGGAGVGSLGQLSLTNRDGDPALTVDLSSAQTLEDVIRLVNAADAGITASVNEARNGITLTDTTGGGGPLVVANGGDGQQTADKLQLAVNANVASVNSGSLDLQVVSEQTKLASLNAGRGIPKGSFLITDSQGASAAVNLSVLKPETVGDVIHAINDLKVGVEARINEQGDGIRLVDTAAGSGKLSVRDSGSGKAAATLKIAGEGKEATIGGQTRQVIDGFTTATVTIEDGDTLKDLAEKINDLDAGVTATVFNDGSGSTPFRLSLVSQVQGRAGELSIDGGSTGLDFETITKAQDALLLVGANLSSSAVLASSTTNEFEGVLPGVKLTIESASSETVSITVQPTNESLVGKVQAFADQYNKLRDKLDELTIFDPTANTTGILFGSNAAVRLDSQLSALISRRVLGAGDIHSLEQLGLSLDATGHLHLNGDELRAAFSEDPAAVQEFFTKENTGFLARLDEVAETLAGADNSVLINHSAALQRKIETLSDRIDSFGRKLTHQREHLLLQFNNLERTISRLQSNLSTVNTLKPLTPLKV